MALVVSPASADFATFYNGTTGYGGPFSGAGTVYNALTTAGATINCPSQAGCPGSDVIQGTLNFSPSVAITATATDGNTPATNVWGDFQPAFGGLGVGTGDVPVGQTCASIRCDDQINVGEILRIHFATPITLLGVATLFDTPHETFGPGFDPSTVGNSNFLFCSTGPNCNPLTQVSFSNANSATGMLGLGAAAVTGTDFAFSGFGTTGVGGTNVEFYVSALTYSAVPGPKVGAGIPA